MSTLFSFVTVRNPRTPTEDEVATGFIHFDRGLDAPLLREVVAARGEGPGSARRALVKARDAGKAWTDVDAVAEEAPDLHAFGRWLSHHAETLTWEELATAAGSAAVGGGSAKASTKGGGGGASGGSAGKSNGGDERQVEARLWDNLALLTYAGGPPEVREAVVWALRALHLIRFDGPKEDDALARRMARATPLFPADAHGITPLERTAPDEEPPAPPDQERPDGDSELRAGLDRLEQAHAELTRMVQKERDRAKGSAQPPPYVPSGDGDSGEAMLSAKDVQARGQDAETSVAPERLVLDRDRLGALSDEARSALDELGVAEGEGLSFTLSQVVEEASRKASALAASVPPQRVTRVGSSFWVRGAPPPGEPAGHETHTVPDDRTRAQYQKFWGTHYPEDREELGSCQVRPLGIGDFRRVEQEICCFVPGEVAHIENVLEGETKERTTEHKTTVERFTSVVGEEEKTQERDSQTTDRFEMEKEVASTIENDLSFEIGVNVAAQYGPVKITADTKFATSQSTKESDKQATAYAKEVTDKTLEKVVSKTREERSTRTIEEFTETNLHRLQATDDHVVGLYRWVDKIYKARVVNYGKRLMFEFLVPEPAAFHLHAMAEHSGDPDLGLEKPVDPRTEDTLTAYGRSPIRSHTDITETNYAFWAATYDATVEPPPSLRVTTGKSYSRADMDHTVQFADSKTDLAMPAGYEAYRFNAVYGLHSQVHSGGPNWITVMVGRRSRFTTTGGSFSDFLDGEDDVVPINTVGRTRFYALNIEVECARTQRAFVQWQQRTFRAVMDGYAAKVGAYQTALAQAQTAAGVLIPGSNPAYNRQTEATELQKACLRLLTSCADLPSEAMKDGQEHGYPEFDCCEAIADGSIVQFFEQLFEWRLLTYVFYPYFWGRKSRWTEIYRLEDVDPLFMAFLRAGFARVVVPVRPGYEGAALRFLADGSIWDGGAAPGVDSPMYVAIENDLKEPVGTVDPEIEPWDITVPTTLTILQCGSACVPGTGLPCPCEDHDDDHHDGHGEGGGDGPGHGDGEPGKGKSDTTSDA